MLAENTGQNLSMPLLHNGYKYKVPMKNCLLTETMQFWLSGNIYVSERKINGKHN